jgi:hypothetical protein
VSGRGGAGAGFARLRLVARVLWSNSIEVLHFVTETNRYGTLLLSSSTISTVVSFLGCSILLLSSTAASAHGILQPFLSQPSLAHFAANFFFCGMIPLAFSDLFVVEKRNTSVFTFTDAKCPIFW